MFKELAKSTGTGNMEQRHPGWECAVHASGVGGLMAGGLGPASDCHHWKGDIQPSASSSGLRTGAMSF